MKRSHQDDVYYRFESPWRELFGAGNEVSRGVINQDVERPGGPDCIDHLLYSIQVANIAGMRMNGSFRGKLSTGCLQNFFSTATNVNDGSEFEKAFGHTFAEPGAAASDEDALGLKKIVAEHEDLSNENYRL